MKQKLFSAAVIALAVSLGACNDDDNSTNDDAGSTTQSQVKTGVFIDAPVGGLGYQTATRQGMTNAAGQFKYKDGESVTFFIDGVELGSALGAAEVPVTMLTHTPSIARLLQTLDGSPNNENLINVADVSLTDTQKSGIQAVLNYEKHISEVGLENLVDPQTVAHHVLAHVGTQQWTEDLVSGKVFESRNEEGSLSIQLDSDYTGTAIDMSEGEPFEMDLAWGFDDAMDNLNITVMVDGETQDIQFSLLGIQEDGTLDLVFLDVVEQDIELEEWIPVTE